MTISFDVGEDLEQIVEAVHSFAEEQIRPYLRDFEEQGQLSAELEALCSKLEQRYSGHTPCRRWC